MHDDVDGGGDDRRSEFAIHATTFRTPECLPKMKIPASIGRRRRLGFVLTAVYVPLKIFRKYNRSFISEASGFDMG